jgi:hypothetical protein|nr:MAG TPA: hypothetical protein [Caudoviricetes sp.]
MKTMYKGVVNSPETFLKENLVQGATTMYVADGSVFGTLPTLAVIGDDESAETVLVESVDGGAYTIKRAFESTAKDWTKGTTVARNFTNYDYQAVIDNIDELSKRKIPSKLSELTDDSTHRFVTDAQRKAWDDKVDKVDGKGLSSNDFTNEDKAKLNGIDLSKYVTDERFTGVTNEALAKADTALEKSSINEEHINQVDTKATDALASVKKLTTYAAVNSARIDAVVSKVKEELSKKADKTEIVDFKRCKVLTQSEYNALSTTEKNREDTLYFIKE